MKKNILSLALLLFSALDAQAENQLSGLLTVDDNKTTATLQVSLTNEVNYIAFMMDILLPEQYTFQTVSPAANSQRLNAANQQLTHILKPGNVLRVIGYNPTNSSISGNVGELFSVQLATSAPTPSYFDWDAAFSNVHFVTDNDIATALSLPVSNEGYSACRIRLGNFFGNENDLLLNIGENQTLTTDGEVPLTDAQEFHEGLIFSSTHTNAPTYTRTGIKNQWGTLVVPFDVDIDDEAPYAIYALAGVTDEGTLRVTKQNGHLAAGTPAIIRIDAAELSGKTYDLTLEASSQVVNASGLLYSDQIDGLRLKGTYEKVDVAEQSGYIISNNQFWNIHDLAYNADGSHKQNNKGEDIKVYVSSFRSYLESALGASAPSLRISEMTESYLETLDALTSGKTEFYDLNGRSLDNLQPGINIIRYGKGKSTTIIVE